MDTEHVKDDLGRIIEIVDRKFVGKFWGVVQENQAKVRVIAALIVAQSNYTVVKAVTELAEETSKALSENAKVLESVSSALRHEVSSAIKQS